MNYKVNWCMADGVFAVPDCVVDNHIKLASGKAAKVLLYIMRHKTLSEENAEQIAASLDKKMSVEDVEDALSYWEQVGVICKADAVPAVIQISAAPADLQPVKQKTDDSVKPDTITPQRAIERSAKMLSPKEIAQRATESNEIGGLLYGAEGILGRVLTHTEQRSFIWLHDYYGMGADIILMITDFCKSINKSNISYIEKIASSWNEKGIVTHQQAEEELLRLQSYYSLEGQVVSKLGLNRSLIKKEREFVSQWAAYGTSADMIEYAYEKTVTATGKVSFNYMNKIISEWYKNNLRTLNDVQNYEKLYSRNKNTSSQTASQQDSNEHSYNLNLLLEHAMNNIPTIKED